MNITADTSVAEMLASKLDKMVDDLVLKALDRMPKSKPFNPNHWVRGKSKACEVFDINRSTLDGWIERGIIDHCMRRDGRIYFFNIPEIYDVFKVEPIRKPKARRR